MTSSPKTSPKQRSRKVTSPSINNPNGTPDTPRRAIRRTLEEGAKNKGAGYGGGIDDLLARTANASHHTPSSGNNSNIFSHAPPPSSPPPPKSSFAHPGRRTIDRRLSNPHGSPSPEMMATGNSAHASSLMGASSSQFLKSYASNSSLNSTNAPGSINGHNRSIRVPLRRSIEHAFNTMSGKVSMPSKFKMVYKSDVMLHFVNSVVAYVMAYCSGPGPGGLSEGYSRILLLCSNFESSISDRSFFECFYEFITLCVKIALPKEGGTAEVNKELCRLFRGADFMPLTPSPEKKDRDGRGSPSPNPDKWSPMKEVKFHHPSPFVPKPKPKSKKRNVPGFKSPKQKQAAVLDQMTMFSAANWRKPKPSGKPKSAYGATTLSKDASISDHEDKLLHVLSHCEKNLTSAQTLRNYMESDYRNEKLKSPRSTRRFNDGGKRALNLSPAIATILPQNSKSDKQKNDYQGDRLLMQTHGLLTVGKKGGVKGGSRSPSPNFFNISPNKNSGVLFTDG
ncbi:hypothetical protein TL16_g03377 [Triparma laevis f. inornata]|uniref:Uncharacterized protein n=1 Tax=Triparma laevis f. inornata TaxID=1714386 RepID=A0A9W6ZY44_9STRA|nr:hypothetical protein TL16_g03377 [Triparma laevis f. inornata]